LDVVPSGYTHPGFAVEPPIKAEDENAEKRNGPELFERSGPLCFEGHAVLRCRRLLAAGEGEVGGTGER
jgi:hypothetical protein